VNGPGRGGLRPAGVAAAALWLLLVWRWFDADTPPRPAWLGAIPPLFLALPAALLFVLWLRAHRDAFRFDLPAFLERWDLALPVLLAVLFRLPFVGQGAAGAVTPDGALSGIVMLRVLNGAEHFVFVPNVPYSGSLKSHIAAVMALALDAPRAFALASVLFYAVYVAALVRLAALLPGASRTVVLGAGLYAAFAPPFVTRYSLSNDGNYVEVLALGTWALLFAVRWVGSPTPRTLALMAGLLLGLAFWSHILAVIPLVVVGLVFLLYEPLRALQSLPALAAGWILGNAPGLLWNLANQGESFRYLFPGGTAVGGGESSVGITTRLSGLLTDQLPVLLGYDLGYGNWTDAALLVLGWVALALLAFAIFRAARAAWQDRDPALVALVLFYAVNLAVALVALPYLPGNARYILFLTGPAAILLASAMAPTAPGRVALALLIAGGGVASLAQLPGTVRTDERWRGFVAALEASGVRACYTDFYIATRVNFLSGERIVCSAKLGPTTTEYFYDYRRHVEAAEGAALIAANSTAARKIEERLREKAVAFERHDLLKPVIVPARKVDPEELFPGRTFPLR
jgi:4-amino-4-deoxy-L-arabinose transferase-like glycosyltransferase